MADENLGTDMSGRPIRRPTVADLVAVKEPKHFFDTRAIMPDGTELIDAGDKYYPIKDGQPDWDNPVPRSKVEGR